ncbi:Uncharacterized protein APZ42_016959 [Daphnia magna]|uniref:Uncharacterized protein n=1 Tax=Daphnia magna TaxID=35525 RepID=A0A165A9K6_9CRUS|nr:Uncharacterized protein APZ42_016959 [Daphnia magna]
MPPETNKPKSQSFNFLRLLLSLAKVCVFASNNFKQEQFLTHRFVLTDKSE